jgi:hypothetical protein
MDDCREVLRNPQDSVFGPGVEEIGGIVLGVGGAGGDVGRPDRRRGSG